MSVKMALGAYTFELNPNIDFKVIKKKKRCSFVETFSSIAYFNWGTSYVGQEIELEWDWMGIDQYDAIQAIYESDAQVVFDPVNTTGIKFNVHVTDFDGVYWLRILSEGLEETFRKKVKLKLLIMSEAT